MTRRTIAIWAAILLAAWFLVPPLFGFRGWEWHQKLVLEVETPSGIKRGGSTVEIHARTEPNWLPISAAGGIQSYVKGESAFVEVAPGKYLFAILDYASGTDRAFSTFPEVGTDGYRRASAMKTFRGTRVVARDKYPDFVTFDDISNPKSIKRVDPDNLSATFGPGVALKGVTLTITDEPVTDSAVEKVLPWLADFYTVPLVNPNQRTQNPPDLLIRSITSGAFKTKGQG
ncbi:hypothetical protein [Mesorhizobium sp.]|uniref:hypothetical protein n=1 Tax=Mesorhizobium sp. TaxID=1871066 RepID=UPI003BAD777D